MAKTGKLVNPRSMFSPVVVMTAGVGNVAYTVAECFPENPMVIARPGVKGLPRVDHGQILVWTPFVDEVIGSWRKIAVAVSTWIHLYIAVL